MPSTVKPRPGALASELARRGLTYTKVSELTGLGLDVLYKFNRGEVVYYETAGKISAVLKKHPRMSVADDLLEGGEPEPTEVSA